jgi:S-(hydroxymethyl)glutathione dehydrogenase/alcohol dehydrogenase
MRAAVAYEVSKPLVVEDVTPMPMGPRDVLVRLAASGICHTDLSVVDGATPVALPLVLGHEGCGVVEEVGGEVRRVRPGDRVLASVSPACGSCWWCVNSMSNHCEMGPAVMSAPRWTLKTKQAATSLCGCGTFAEAMVVHEASVVAVETDLADEELALLGCGVTTGLGAALNTAGVVAGSSVAVIGCGGVGQSVVQGARIAGAATIVAVDPPGGESRACGWALPTQSIRQTTTRSSR